MESLNLDFYGKIRRLGNADIVKVFSLNALSTFIRMLSGLITVKVIALFIGPSGIALLGQLQNFVTLTLGYANGGIQNGVTKYVAEFKDKGQEVKKYLSTGLKITLFFTLIASAILIFFNQYLSNWVMQSDEYGYVFIIFGITIFLYTLNLLLISILNGYKEFRKYVIVNITGSIFGLLFIAILVYFGGIPGALISAVTYQSLVFFVTLWLCRKCVWFKFSNFKDNIDKSVVKDYLNYSVMALVSLSLSPISQMFLRGYVISEISPVEAGWWEAMNRLSSAYLMIITTSFSVYYLPRLSELQSPMELHKEIIKCYKFLIPLLLFVLVLIYIAKHLIVYILLSPEFYAMEMLFIWQILGDFFKVISWVLAYIMLAKAMTMKFITTEIVFVTIHTLLSFGLMKINGIVGLTQGYLINYILYTVVMIYLFRNLLFFKAAK